MSQGIALEEDRIASESHRPGIMDELFHVDGLVLLALGIEALLKVDPAQTS